MRRSCRAVLLVLLAIGLPARAAGAPSDTVDVAVFAINDLHGNLMPPPGGIALPDPADPAHKQAIAAGGVAYMATMIRGLRAQHANSVFVAAGDLIGASPLLSGLFHDEPTVQSLSLMGLEFSAVGNHEFDKGAAELLRMQNGGCHPVDGCKGPTPFTGATFRYLAANTIVAKTGKTLFPPYAIKTFDGIPVAFIGVTLKDAPAIIAPASAAGLEFRDEADSVNALVPVLRARGIEAIVVLIHQGGEQSGGPDDCTGFKGAIADIVRKFDKAVDVVVSGHTHRAYNCVIDGRVVTSAHRYGTLVTEIDLKLDRKTHDVASAAAHNLVVRDEALSPDPAQMKLIAAYDALSAPLAGRVAGRVTATVPEKANAAGESALGDLIADSELAAAAPAHAQIAFVNSGGIRTDLVAAADGTVTYGDLFSVLPFGNALVTETLSGRAIARLLEQQWADPSEVKILQPSAGFTYTWRASRPAGAKVVPGTIRLNGRPIQPGALYRVAVPDFLATGGDGFTVLAAGTGKTPGGPCIDALESYLRARSPLTPKTAGRITRRD
jgi:5'-nucleotidase